MRDEPAPEFSRPVAIDRLGDVETVREIEATADERVKLAKRYGVDDVGELRATVRLNHVTNRIVGVSAAFEATMTQRCVVTLEPVQSVVKGEFFLEFSDDTDINDVQTSIVIEGDEPEPPEPIQNGMIDIGEVVAEQVALEINPFPRAPGVQFAGGEGIDTADEGRAKPFAKLASLKEKLERSN